MMAVDPKLVKELRNLTGAGVMDVKAALEAAKGNKEKAIEDLKRKGQAKAGQRSGRATSAGVIDTYQHLGRVGVLVEVNCETDFVAKTKEFKDFAHEVAMQVASMNPAYVSEADIPKQEVGKIDIQTACLMKQPSIKDPEQTIEAKLKDLAAKLGENIVISRFVRYELGEQS